MTKKSTIMALATVMFTASALGFNGIAFADSQTSQSSWKSSQRQIKNYLKHAPSVMGIVTSINNSIIVINSKNNINYTIDASTAKILKNRNTIIKVSDILVGDTIMAQGTITGNNVLATTIFDGKTIVSKKSHKNFPGVIGIVSSVNGTTISVTTKNNIVYNVDISSAKIEKGSPAINAHIGDILNGDTVMVRGTVNGSSVIAKTILDGKIPLRKIRKK
ncbi:MAG: hypothetical protein KGI58_01095 [Patescibacteria group bacterium]|nr:hypothetical protein [Patescibacteria group bacterium]